MRFFLLLRVNEFNSDQAVFVSALEREEKGPYSLGFDCYGGRQFIQYS